MKIYLPIIVVKDGCVTTLQESDCVVFSNSISGGTDLYFERQGKRLHIVRPNEPRISPEDSQAYFELGTFLLLFDQPGLGEMNSLVNTLCTANGLKAVRLEQKSGSETRFRLERWPDEIREQINRGAELKAVRQTASLL